MARVILLGAGGHCRVVIEAIRASGGLDIVGVTDVAAKVGGEVLGVPVIGTDEVLAAQRQAGVEHCFITAGSTGYPRLRIRLAELASDAGFEPVSVVHPTAWVSPSARLGAGTFVGAGAAVNAGAVIGRDCIINTGAIVEHDCVLGDLTHLAPGVTLSGDVSIGRYTHVGAGTAVRQGIAVGEATVIGVGSVVTDDISDRVVAYGNPCREVRPADV